MNNRYRECREAVGMSQKQVAFAIGVKPPQISKWEAGTQKPSRENCIKLAVLYNVSLDYLIGTDSSADNDDEIMIMRERLRRDPDYRLLFDAVSHLPPLFFQPPNRRRSSKRHNHRNRRTCIICYHLKKLCSYSTC